MHLLMPARIAKHPARLGDPEIAHFAAEDGVPVGLVAGPIGEAVVAEAEVSGHPGF